MGLCTEQQIAEVLKREPNYNMFTCYNKLGTTPLEILNTLRQGAMATGAFPSKSFRLWNIDESFYNTLDPEQSWMGFEWETSWRSHEDRAAAIAWAWDNTTGCSFDPEGSGYATEITLPPENMDAYTAGTSQFQKLIAGVESISNRGLGKESHNGTHVNFSLGGEVRKLDSNTTHKLYQALANTINRALANFTSDQRAALFQRSPLYGGALNMGEYIEMKVFRSTYSSAQFEQYVRISKALVHFSEYMVNNYLLDNGRLTKFSGIEPNAYNGLNCTNLFEVLTEGAVPEVTEMLNITRDDWMYSGWIGDYRGTHSDMVSIQVEDAAYWEGVHYAYMDDEYSDYENFYHDEEDEEDY